jgi:hypothetical protein
MRGVRPGCCLDRLRPPRLWPSTEGRRTGPTGDRRLQLLRSLPPVHALQHARVLVPHHRRDEVERHARLHQAVGEGPAEVVRAARRDPRPLAGGVKVPADVRPGREHCSVLAARVPDRELEKGAMRGRDEWNHAVPRLSLRTVHVHEAEIRADVEPLRALRLAPVGRGRNHERRTGGVIGRELRDEDIHLRGRKLPLLGLVLGREADGHHRLRIATRGPAAASTRRCFKRAKRGSYCLRTGKRPTSPVSPTSPRAWSRSVARPSSMRAR